MKILIDFTQIPIKKVGVGNYALFLILELSKLKTDTSFYILVLSDDNETLELLSGFNNNFKLININKVFRNLILRFLLEQIYIPFLICKLKIDKIHSLHYSFPIFPMRVTKIVTLHDMTFFLYPKFHKTFHVFYFKIFINLSIRYCDEIICVSDSTRRDVIRILNLKNELIKKIIVIPLGTNYQFPYQSNLKTLKKFGLISKKYLLFIGTLEPRKNIISLIQAYSKLKECNSINMELVIVGKKGWHYEEIFRLVKKLNLTDKVIFTGFIEENEKKDLLWHSFSFLYTSYYEGFGIPVLEAMAFGIPTITSNISSIPEVVGDAAILVNPKNVIEIVEAVKSLINNKQVYDDLVKKSLIQSIKFTWNKMAIDTLNLYTEHHKSYC